MDYFSESFGFGEFKPKAIELLKTTIKILNEFDINHFLISGTLLGYIRHNDFIPWDDDIDILVDSSILDKLDKIAKKYGNITLLFNVKYDSIKICFDEGLEIPDKFWEDKSISGLLPSEKKYTFPFIDMFIYESGPSTHICGDDGELTFRGETKKVFLPFSGACKSCFRFISKEHIVFFHNDWKKTDFFPPKKVNFLGIECNIPKNPHKFLKNNYGSNYMKVIESPVRIHKTNSKIEHIIKQDYVRS